VPVKGVDASAQPVGNDFAFEFDLRRFDPEGLAEEV
jgi:hypothetical protein